MHKTPSRSGHIFLPVLCTLLVLATALSLIQFLRFVAANPGFQLNDFFMAYRPSAAILYDDLSAIYDLDSIEQWLQGDKTRTFHPVLYPPYGLFLFYPLALLDPLRSGVVWFSAHVIALVLVLRMQAMRRIFADVPATYVIMFFFPFCALTLVNGQVGILCATLFFLVIIWRNTHPIPAGIAFSILCFKPQMVFALALLLLQEKNLKAFIAIALCLAIEVLASLMLWGPPLWLDYIKITALSGMVVSAAFPFFFKQMCSVFMALRMVGLSSEWAHLLQTVTICGVVLSLWLALKRCTDDRQRLLLLGPATFLLSPYCFAYDTVILAPVCIIFSAVIRSGVASRAIYVALVLLAFLPVVTIKLQGLLHFPYAAVAIVFSYIIASKHIFSSPQVSPDAQNTLA